jgi:hypothetical protein
MEPNEQLVKVIGMCLYALIYCVLEQPVRVCFFRDEFATCFVFLVAQIIIYPSAYKQYIW